MEICLFVAVSGLVLMGFVWVVHKCGYRISMVLIEPRPDDNDDDDGGDFLDPSIVPRSPYSYMDLDN